MTVVINYWAVIVVAIINTVLGFLWFGPIFGKYWTRLMGWTPEQMEKGREEMQGKMWKMVGTAFVVSAITGWVLAHSIIFAGSYLGSMGISSGLMTGFFTWLGFIFPVNLSSVLWEGKPWKYFFLTTSYYLVSLLIVGSVLAVWM